KEAAPASTTYAGGSWTNGAPNSPDTDAVISENYNGAGFTAKDITVSSGASLTIPSGQTINAANMTVQDNANFLQEGVLSLTGTFTLNKAATSVADRYVFWSSPVEVQEMYTFYNNGAPQYVMDYNTATDVYINIPTSAIAVAGKGYSVKVPAGATMGQFIGKPNNGIIPVTLETTGNAWNLIGNPYPSNLNLTSLYNAGNNGIDASIYFWNNENAGNVQQASTDADWNIFNASGTGTWQNTTGGLTPNGTAVKPGQGFIVKATANSTVFNNSMR